MRRWSGEARNDANTHTYKSVCDALLTNEVLFMTSGVSVVVPTWFLGWMDQLCWGTVECVESFHVLDCDIKRDTCRFLGGVSSSIYLVRVADTSSAAFSLLSTGRGIWFCILMWYDVIHAILVWESPSHNVPHLELFYGCSCYVFFLFLRVSRTCIRWQLCRLSVLFLWLLFCKSYLVWTGVV